MHPDVTAALTRPTRRTATAALYVATIAVYSDMYITQPLLPELGREFGTAPATTGLTVSAVVLAIALASSVYGPLGDALGRKRVMVGACALLALPTLLCAVAPSFGTLLLFRAAQGLLIPGVTAVAVAYLGDQFGSDNLGALVGGWIAATVTGGLTGRVLSGWIAEHVGWRAAFVVFAVLTLVGAVAMAWALPGGAARERVAWAHAYRGMLAHFRDQRLVGGFVIGGALFFAFIGTFTYLPYLLTAAPFHLSTGLVSSVYVVYLAGVLVSPLAGRLSTRHGRRALVAAGLLIAAVGIAGTLFPSLPLIVTALIVLCAGMFTAQAVAPAYVNATARTAKGGASALYLTSYYVGGALGSFLPGYAWQSWGWPGVVAVCLAALALALWADWALCK